jgi:hypothetical protein
LGRREAALGVENEGDGAVVDELDRHVGAEHARADLEAALAEVGGESVDERFRDLARCRAVPRGSPPLLSVRVERELADDDDGCSGVSPARMRRSAIFRARSRASTSVSPCVTPMSATRPSRSNDATTSPSTETEAREAR